MSAVAPEVARVVVPVVPDLLAQVIERGGAWDCVRVHAYHHSEASHCVLGWAVHLAGAAGYALERQVGPARAGAAIWQASTGYVPPFFHHDQQAWDWLLATAGK
jgi:hypothetical protein